MSFRRRVVTGAEAGAIAAAAIELSIFVLDLIRLQPLATPAALSGVAVGPGAWTIELTSFAGALGFVWAGVQILALTAAHLLTFALAGVVASLLFDWTRFGGLGRLAVVVALCTIAFYGTLAWASSIVALESVGMVSVISMNVLAALMLAATLRFASTVEAKRQEDDAT